MPIGTLEGPDLYYEERGSGPSILFIHGLLTDAGTWNEQVSRLAANFRCVVYDRRGNSRSRQMRSGEAGPEGHAEDAAHLITRLELQPCLLVASSVGAVIAVEIMRRFPDLLRGAVLSEPPLFSLDPVEGSALVRRLSTEVSATLENYGPRAAVERFSEWMDREAWLWAAQDERDRIVANFRTLMEALRGEPYRIAAQELARIRVPSLVIQGDRSPLAFQRVARRLSALMSCSTLVTIPNCGHLTYLHQPGAFATLVKEFAAIPCDR